MHSMIEDICAPPLNMANETVRCLYFLYTQLQILFYCWHLLKHIALRMLRISKPWFFPPTLTFTTGWTSFSEAISLKSPIFHIHPNFEKMTQVITTHMRQNYNTIAILVYQSSNWLRGYALSYGIAGHKWFCDRPRFIALSKDDCWFCFVTKWWTVSTTISAAIFLAHTDAKSALKQQ